MTGDQPERGQVPQDRPLALWPMEPPTPPGLASDVAQLNETALRFFRSRLADSWVPHHLERRGFDSSIQQRWQAGYAPAGWDALTSYLRALRCPDPLTETAGLARRSQRGTLIDTFRDRAMLPIRSADGTVSAFIGRAPEDAGPEVPRYVNSPRTCLYRKGETLFGLWEARQAIAAGAQPVIVEGPFDAIAVTTACTGRCAGVAPCGTALTAEQVRTLSQVADLGRTGALVAFDSDAAGRRAAIRAYDLLTPYTDKVWAVALPAGQDPAQVFTEHGPSALAEIATHPHPLADLVTDAVVDKWSRWLKYPEGQINALRATAPVIAAMPVRHVAWQVARLAHRLGLDYATVTEAVTDALPQVIAETTTTSPGERAAGVPYRAAAVAGRDLPGGPTQASSQALIAAPSRAPPGPARDDRTSLPARRIHGH
jgi:DNA primase catalytic core